MIRVFLAISIFILTNVYPMPSWSEKYDNEKSRDDIPKREVKIRVRTKADFTGTVVAVNLERKTISIKNRGIVVTFDVINPTLKGYRSMEQIKIGDTVFISYIDDGATITKDGLVNVEHKHVPTIKADGKTLEKGSDNRKVRVARYPDRRPIRVKEKTGSYAFKDVDNNGDGKITPVELSSVVSDLTIESFKRYDKNNDNLLNEDEYQRFKRDFFER